MIIRPSSQYRVELFDQYLGCSPSVAFGEEFAFVKLRFKQPDSDTSQLIEQAVVRSAVTPSLEDSSQNFRFAAAVAAFGQLLRGGELMEDFTMEDAIDLARDARGDDPWGYRSEFLQLARLAGSLSE